jgi:protein-L-isoaspartate O-methyltransferase
MSLFDAGFDYEVVLIDLGLKKRPEHAPFDTIIITCVQTIVPELIKAQLEEVGCMF